MLEYTLFPTLDLPKTPAFGLVDRLSIHIDIPMPTLNIIVLWSRVSTHRQAPERQ